MTALASPNLPPGIARDSFWTRIAGEIADAIGRGIYPPGERLPSEHALAEQFGVNRHTIRRSLASLSQQGLLRVAQGSGTYVETFAVDLILSRRTRHQQNLNQAGLRGALEVLQQRNCRATVAEAKALRVSPRSKLLCLEIRGVAEQQVLHFSERYFPLPRFADLADVVRETGSITAAFSRAGVQDYTRLESRITAQMPTATIAARLQQPVSRPVLRVESVNIDLQGVAIEWARTWFAGDRVKITVSHDD
jgi:GntR family phosphonate transport system transcriptional regulator